MSSDTSALSEFFQTIVLVLIAFLLWGILLRLDRMLILQERQSRLPVEYSVTDTVTDITPSMLTEEGSRLLRLLQAPPDDSGAGGDTGS